MIIFSGRNQWLLVVYIKISRIVRLRKWGEKMIIQKSNILVPLSEWEVPRNIRPCWSLAIREVNLCSHVKISTSPKFQIRIRQSDFPSPPDNPSLHSLMKNNANRENSINLHIIFQLTSIFYFVLSWSIPAIIF